MDTTSKLLLGGAGALALLVGVLVYAAVGAAQGMGHATSMVVVARQQIPERTLFTGSNVDELLTLREFPTDLVPEGALTQPVNAVGKVATTKLAPGEVVLGTIDRLASGEGATARPAASIPRDKVALAINATESLSVAGAVQPGDRVDVIATWNRPNSGTVTKNIFQDVRVFAVGRWQREGPPPAGSNNQVATVTLLLDYDQAAVLEHLIQTGGGISLALRRFDQTDQQGTEPITTEAITRRFFGIDGSSVPTVAGAAER
jgi:pilus assembly protein CpaB